MQAGKILKLLPNHAPMRFFFLFMHVSALYFLPTCVSPGVEALKSDGHTIPTDLFRKGKWTKAVKALNQGLQ